MRGEGGEGGGGRGEGETEFVERLLRMLLGWLTQLEATGSRSLGESSHVTIQPHTDIYTDINSNIQPAIDI